MQIKYWQRRTKIILWTSLVLFLFGLAVGLADIMQFKAGTSFGIARNHPYIAIILTLCLFFAAVITPVVILEQKCGFSKEKEKEVHKYYRFGDGFGIVKCSGCGIEFSATEEYCLECGAKNPYYWDSLITRLADAFAIPGFMRY